jgi:hypothetical protein
VHSIEERDNVGCAFIWILVDSIVFSEDRYFRSNTWHFIAIQEVISKHKNSSRRRLYFSI